MVKALDLGSRGFGLLVFLLILVAIALSAISLHTEANTYVFKKTVSLYNDNIIDLTSIINEELLYKGITRSYLEIRLVDCSNPIKYEIVDTYHNISKKYVQPPDQAKLINLTSPFSIIIFNNTNVNYYCKADLSITVINNERKYAILSIPAFIVGLVSLILMMIFLVEYTVTRIYEKKK